MYDLTIRLFISLINRLEEMDQQLFLLINNRGSNSFFDTILPLTRESIIWIPLYSFILLVAWNRFGVKTLYWLLGAIITVAITDIVSSQIIKENVIRLRPCRDPDFAFNVIFRVKYCPGSSSFTSSHATNHFGMAFYIFATLKPFFSKKWLRLLFLWAFAICYAQVYVGVHYPFDVTCGALLGMLLGYITSSQFNRRIKLGKPLSRPVISS
jgi:membrane-associated phospholipid phosphatase